MNGGARARRPASPAPACALVVALAFAPAGAAQVTLAPHVVTAARAPQAPATVPFSLTTLDGDRLRDAPSVAIDGVLRGVPGFSLFRRSDSLSANPTAQGVSLRGIGPSGASRSLVLLDGVPLNDPFGGWVAWSKVPRHSLSGVEIVRGGGGTAWGNSALGGVVQLFTHAPGRSGPAIHATAGDHDTRGAEIDASLPAGSGTIGVTARAFATGGFHLVAPEDRGPVDRPAASRHRWLALRWHQPFGAGAQLTVTGRAFREHRNNGTPYQRNSSSEDFVSASLVVVSRPGFTWMATAYGQEQDFSSTFSGVSADRAAETPAADQFSVPADAIGAAWTGAWEHPGGSRTSAGADLRRVRGETREHFFLSGGNFARRRVAGGTQESAGLFALHERQLGPGWRATAGARLDWWREGDGHRDETDRATGAVLRTERPAGADGLELSPSAGFVWQPAPDWRVRGAAHHAFRRPTLNELYRPFRVGNVITEANAALRTERVTGAEAGVEWTLRSGSGLRTREPPPAAGRTAGAPAPDTGRETRATFAATAFWNELRDAVGNVTLVSGPGNFPLFGFIPAGGAGRQRLNLDRLRVRGVELSAEFRPTPGFSVRADYLYDDATVRRARIAPALEGNRLAQVPRHAAILSASWRAPGGITLSPRLRWLDRQFEDDENLLRLGAAVVLDLGVTIPVGASGGVFLQAENVGDARVETGRTAAGVVSTGTPRLVLGGFRAAW